jgi:1-acyl-sn-glycerol-3-phosphate acyltransferase
VEVSVPDQHRRRPKVGFWYALVVAVVKPLMLLLTNRDWRGAENIPATGGFIVAANHVSELDPLVVGHFLYDQRRPPRFLAKVELFRSAPLKWILEGAKQIPVHRRALDASAALGPAVAALHAGECVLVYPEGSATRDPELWPMKAKTGVARLALLSGAPVIPVAQWGPQEILPYKARRPKLFPRRTMRVLAGQPVDLTPYLGRPLTADLLHAATEAIMRRVADHLAELRGGPAPVEFYDMKAAAQAKESA